MTVILKPIVTEKSSREQASGVYAFAVAPTANKHLVRAEIIKTHKVTPRRINIINTPTKRVLVRGKVGRRPGYKKALVYLKSGDSLNLTAK